MGDPDVISTGFAEGGAGSHGESLLLEEPIGEGKGIHPESFDGREEVEGA